MSQRIAINVRYGGFGLSEAAYLKLIEWGVPIRKYVEPTRNDSMGLYENETANDGEVIFDRELTPPEANSFSALYWKYKGARGTERYWDCWTHEHRQHPLVLRVIDELGTTANGPFAELKIVEIPDGVDWEIDEYDGREHIAAKHEVWA